MTELQRACQLEESIIRQLFLKIDPRIADHLVQLAGAKCLPPSSRKKSRPRPNGEPVSPAVDFTTGS